MIAWLVEEVVRARVPPLDGWLHDVALRHRGGGVVDVALRSGRRHGGR